MLSTKQRTLISLALGIIAGFVFSLINGRDVPTSLLSALIFGILVAAIVAVLSWAMEYAQRKGYPGWMGFLLVLFLNIVGVLILWLLPERRVQAV
jgi:drug/metabolite transporter (DMT)-like permease